MAEKKTWWATHRPTTRRLAQLYCALLYNANLKGFAEGRIYTGAAKAVCVPGLNCYSCPGAVGACPLGALQNAVASSGARAGTYVLGILLLYGLMLGRTVCGWLCPFGMLQELLHKIPTPKIRKCRGTRALSYLKYGVLAVFVLAIPLWYGLKVHLPLPAFCKLICPAGTFEGAVPLLSHPSNAAFLSLLGPLFTRKAAILFFVALACVFCYRAFCRFLCPLGAIYGFFCRVAILGVKVDDSACTRCGACVRACPMDVRRVGDHECIHCGDCMAVCPEKAISIKAGRITLKAPAPAPDLRAEPGFPKEAQRKKQKGRLIWAILLLALCGALAYFHFAPEREPADPAPLGYEAGQQLQDFSVKTLDGGEFRLREERGHVTVLNLWATWCTPCVRELPYFDRLRQEHPEIAVLAIHSPEVTEDVETWLQETDWDHLRFSVDGDGTIWPLLNGGDVLPQTIVLNARGEVTYNRAGSVSYETLEELLAEAEASVG